MAGAIEWENVNVAAAFILGAVFATVATIRVMRAVVTVLRREVRRRPGDDDGPAAE